ncbi:MAG: hypothetical protein IT538_03435 [Variibacter sp.]|nr:hypothetical protein [Variibacter sp.]
MAERQEVVRATLMAYFPMFIATLSLVTSIYNGYLNNKFVDFVQRNTGRMEYMHTCKEIIEAYYQVKSRASLIRAGAERQRAAGTAAQGAGAEHTDGINAVNRFAALGTYLANLRDDATRVRYTELSVLLEKIVHDAAQPGADLAALFAPADRIFTEMNNDCVRFAQGSPL